MHQIIVQKLYQEFENLCWYYRVQLNKPLIELVGGSSLLGQWDALRRSIRLSEALLEYPWDMVIEVLKHEMAHQVCSEIYQLDDGHGPYFQKACFELGVAPWARRAAVDLDQNATAYLKSIESRHQRSPDLNEVDQRAYRKIQKLLALSESSNVHESSLAMQAARRLIEQHAATAVHFDDAQMDYSVIYLKTKRIPAHISHLASILNSHFLVQVITTSYYDAKAAETYRALEVVGTKINISMALHVYHFVLNRLHLFWKEYQEQRCGESFGYFDARCDKSSFYIGVLQGFSDQLSKQKAKDRRREDPYRASTARPSSQVDFNVSSASTSSQEVAQHKALLEIESKTEQWTDQRFPRLRNKSRRGSRSINAEAYYAGQERGRTMQLNRPVGSGKTALLN